MDKKAPQMIKEWAEVEGRKMKWLAAQVPANQADLSRWMNSHTVPRRSNRERLATITGLDISNEESWI